MTVSKKLLLYYNPDEKDLFASQDTKDNKYEKNKAIHNEDKLLWGASKKLPKKGQDQIWKEISLGRMFSKCSQKKTFLLRTIPRRYPNIKKIRFTQKQWLAVDRTLYKLFDKLDEKWR